MKRLIASVLVCALSVAAFAQENAETKTVQPVEQKRHAAVWPAFFALCEWPDTPDLVGFRLTIPFSTRQEVVSGFDIGLWGRCMDFEGFQFNVLRNDASDRCYGFQVGLYNSVGGDNFGIQVGLWNETASMRGIQAGLVNAGGDVQGFQFGFINRAESLYGAQVGVVNLIRNAEVPFFPVANIGF